MVINDKTYRIRPAPVIQVIGIEKAGDQGEVTGDDAQVARGLPQEDSWCRYSLQQAWATSGQTGHGGHGYQEMKRKSGWQ